MRNQDSGIAVADALMVSIFELVRPSFCGFFSEYEILIGLESRTQKLVSHDMNWTEKFRSMLSFARPESSL